MELDLADERPWILPPPEMLDCFREAFRNPKAMKTDLALESVAKKMYRDDPAAFLNRLERMEKAHSEAEAKVLIEREKLKPTTLTMDASTEECIALVEKLLKEAKDEKLIKEAKDGN